MANDTFGRRIPFSYLEYVHMRFMKNYGRVVHHAPAYAMNDEFSRVLHQQMEFFSSNPSVDTLNRVRGEVSEIWSVMMEKIEKIMERGDRIELLVDKTATMQDSSFHFRKQSKRLRRALWMKNAKLLTTLGFWAGHRNSKIRVILALVWENDTKLDISNNRIKRATGHLVYQKRFYRTKFCICPGGSQVNSARITDSIHYKLL
ncbi:hypothetical protein Bca52824_023153 [Brassica carinata]|uniref:V-SNARE coiled-coil homology domain-containing protein n=1 Tax=Brassica carinata TaxID=52824 RepID=A0A8X7VHZ6_BRACI|nr:hypothetical protein Bca52824_023153 [Brassica carinata]